MIKTRYPVEKFLPADGNEPIAQQISSSLLKTVEDLVARFDGKDEAWASRKPAPDKWSAKEIIGHLLDSAANNHQRFVRVQYVAEKVFPGYEQMEWVSLQHHQERTWKELLEFWKAYNLHLAHVIRYIGPEYFKAVLTVGGGEPQTLEFVATDYVGHVQHHIKQIEQR